jgi:MMPL family
VLPRRAQIPFGTPSGSSSSAERQEADRRDVPSAIRVAVRRASRAISIAALALALSFAMLAIIPIDPFRSFAFAACAGVIIDAFVVRTLMIRALLAVVGEAGAQVRLATPDVPFPERSTDLGRGGSNSRRMVERFPAHLWGEPRGCVLPGLVCPEVEFGLGGVVRSSPPSPVGGRAAPPLTPGRCKPR